MNVWEGKFPKENQLKDGFYGLAPVISFPPNDYGLYNMLGKIDEYLHHQYHQHHNPHHHHQIIIIIIIIQIINIIILIISIIIIIVLLILSNHFIIDLITYRKCVGMGERR